MLIKDYLKNEKEELPLWLKNYKKGQQLDFSEILKSKIVYYPGAYTDGQAIKTFNSAHFAHLFVYVDYMIEEKYIKEELTKQNAFTGYCLVDIQNVTENQLVVSWMPHISLSQEQLKQMQSFPTNLHKPFAVFAVYERDENLTDEHGAKRFAVLYISADGIATYDAMFANLGKAPDVLILQDHGFGGNYDKFGRGGLMEKIAKATNTYPKYIVCGDNTDIWDRYKIVPEVDKIFANIWRRLYKLKNEF